MSLMNGASIPNASFQRSFESLLWGWLLSCRCNLSEQAVATRTLSKVYLHLVSFQYKGVGEVCRLNILSARSMMWNEIASLAGVQSGVTIWVGARKSASRIITTRQTLSTISSKMWDWLFIKTPVWVHCRTQAVLQRCCGCLDQKR